MNDRTRRGSRERWPARGAAGPLVGLVAITLALRPASAGAASKTECLAAHEKGQELRDAGRLREAREAFLVCAQPSCPGAAQADCVPWLRDIDPMIPSLVVGARDGAGHDLLEARLLIDGKLVSERLDGAPVALDPGSHRVQIEGAGGQAEQSVIVRQGEKNRLVTLSLGAASAASSTSATSSAPVVVAAPSAPVGAWVATGVGALSLGAFAYFGLTARSKLDDLKHSCSPRCSDDEASPVRTRALVADVSLGVSVVALGLATYLWLSPRSTPSPAARVLSLHLGASPRPGGGALSWWWSF